MEIINNQTLINENLINDSLLIVGQVGTGKTVLIKHLIMYYAAAEKKVGVLCKEREHFELEPIRAQLQDKLTVHYLEDKGLDDVHLFIENVDVVVIDEGDYTIGSGENLHPILDLCQNKIKIVAYQTVDSISKSQTYLESVVDRFEKTVYFQTRDSFSTQFLLGNELAGKLPQLSVGRAMVVPTGGNVSYAN